MTSFRHRPSSGLSTMIERTPVTLAVLIAYIGLALLTGVFQADHRALIDHGAAVPTLIATGEPWRLLTYAFLHGGIIHLLFNTMALIQLGPALEVRLGSTRFAILYLVAALGGGVGGVLGIAPFEGGTDAAVYRPLVGGSGALFGMLGALVALNLRAGRSLLDFFEDQSSRSLLTLIGIYIVIGMIIPVISNSGHIGGLLAGFGVTLLWFDPGRHAGATLRGRRVAQTLFVLLLGGWTVYAVEPVLRWDHQLMRAKDATDTEGATEWLRAFQVGRDAPVPDLRNLADAWGEERARRWRKLVMPD